MNLLEQMTEHHCTFLAELTMAGNWRLFAFLWPETWQMCRSVKPAYDHNCNSDNLDKVVTVNSIDVSKKSGKNK